MIFDLSPGDVVQIGKAVTLTVLAVEGDLIRFKVEPMQRECLSNGTHCEEADGGWKMSGWELN